MERKIAGSGKSLRVLKRLSFGAKRGIGSLLGLTRTQITRFTGDENVLNIWKRDQRTREAGDVYGDID